MFHPEPHVKAIVEPKNGLLKDFHSPIIMEEESHVLSPSS